MKARPADKLHDLVHGVEEDHGGEPKHPIAAELKNKAAADKSTRP